MHANHETRVTQMRERWRSRPRKRTPDTCPMHVCPRCDARMVKRACPTCKRKDGTALRIRFCALCDGGPIAITREVANG